MLWDWKAKIKWHRPAKRINHASRITIPTEVANGRPMARMPQISMTTPQTIDQPLAFLTEPRVVSEFILLVLLVCFRSDYRNDSTNTRLVASVTPGCPQSGLKRAGSAHPESERSGTKQTCAASSRKQSIRSPLLPIIEIRPFRNGWKVIEAPGVEPVFLNQEQAVDYATCRACFRSMSFHYIGFGLACRA